jgi:SAM-dependent methyltransferase
MSEQAATREGTGTDGFFETEEALDLYMERIEDRSLFTGERKAVDRYFGDPPATALDVGCGVGRVASLLHDRGFDVTGIDVSEPFVDRARSLFPEVEFRAEDVRDMPFASGTFDHVVFSFYGLDYVHPESEREAALREIRRVLKPGGTFVFSTHNGWHPIVPTSARDLIACGYDVVDLYLRPKNHDRLFSRYKVESVPLGEIETYVSNPVHQFRQLRDCGFTPVDVVGQHEGRRRFFERQPHFVARK